MKLQKKTQQQASIEQQRSGFSLVELLVVIAIIGILIALLLPAIQSARESGRKTACMSNAYQLGMAINRFDQDKGKVPGYLNKWPSQYTSWPVMCLPYIERNDLYDPSSTIRKTVVGVFVCPSALPDPRNLAPLTYVANVGNNADTTPSLYCGVVPNNLVSSYSLEDVADGDGTATTLLFGERAYGRSYEIQHQWSVAYSSLLTPVLYHLEIDGLRRDPTNPPTTGFLGGYQGFGLPVTSNQKNMFRSPHGTGSVVAFCDGHTYFLGNDINTNVYMQLVTSNSSRIPDIGGGPSPYRPKNTDGSFYILNESDF